MASPDRPAEMLDIEWLVALKEIRQLKARRDRYVGSHNYDGSESRYAPDHIFDGNEATWNSPAELTKNLRATRESGSNDVHMSHGSEICFVTPTKARGIREMTGAHVVKDANGEDEWEISFGNYYEYEKRDGELVFTLRR